jgi:hypothetical protein
VSDYRSGPGSLGYRAASVLTSPPALTWPNARLKAREGALGAAQVPVPVTFAKTEVTGKSASAGWRQGGAGAGARGDGEGN